MTESIALNRIASYIMAERGSNHTFGRMVAETDLRLMEKALLA